MKPSPRAVLRLPAGSVSAALFVPGGQPVSESICVCTNKPASCGGRDSCRSALKPLWVWALQMRPGVQDAPGECRHRAPKEFAGGLEQPSLAAVPKSRAAPTAEGQSEMEIQQDFQGEGEQGSFHKVLTQNFSFSGLLVFFGVCSEGSPSWKSSQPDAAVLLEAAPSWQCPDTTQGCCSRRLHANAAISV